MIWFDCETYSEVPIQHGTYKYAESAEVMVVTYAFDDGPVHTWDLTAGEELPADLDYMLDDPDEPICAHFAMFDRNVLRLSRNLRRVIPIERWRCSMTKAYAHSLPGSLDKLCTVLKVPYDLRKQADGKRLIHLFCKPRGAHVKIQRATRETHPEDWKKFLDYAASDVEAMRVVYNKLPNWNYQGTELALWHLDQRINDRGIEMDVDFAKAAIRATQKAQRKLKQEVQDATDYDEELDEGVESATQRDALLEFILEEHGVMLPDMKKSTLERRLLDQELPYEVRNLINIRLQASTSSTAKYSALMRGVQGDNRIRGTLQFCGAQRTGRWAGRLLQPHNMNRPDMEADDIAFGIESILADACDIFYDNVMRVAANGIRGVIVAKHGKKLVPTDLSNIEGRAAAYLANEEWKLEAYREFDLDPKNPAKDLYNVTYGRAFNYPPEKIDKNTQDGYMRRQIGKVMELFLAYEGGEGAFATGAATYKIDMEALRVAAEPLIPPGVMQEAIAFIKWMDEKFPHRKRAMTQEQRYVVTALKMMWRTKNAMITSYWPELQEMAIVAVNNPGTWHQARKLAFRRDGAWLRMRLPSGRFLCYPSPQVNNGKLSYMGVNQYTRQWGRISTYGGKLFENACQAFARDVLAYHMPMLEEAGYPIVLHVHDENVPEVPDLPSYSAEEAARLMVSELPWHAGLPLSAAGFETYRYRKD